MAHHQGPHITCHINNLFHQNILQKRFMKNPQIQAKLIFLLQEKMPENIIITKEEKRENRKNEICRWPKVIHKRKLQNLLLDYHKSKILSKMKIIRL